MEIPDMIHKLSGTYSEYEIFSDWVKSYALSISNTTDIIHGKVWEDRERQYMELVKKTWKRYNAGIFQDECHADRRDGKRYA